MLKLLTLFFLALGLFSCTNLFYQQDRFLYYPPDKLNFVFENHKIASKDGTKLHAWLFPAQKNKVKAKKSKGLVIHFHGNAQNMSSHYLSVVWMAQQGFDVLVWDYRGYGISEGDPNLEGVYEDSLAALAFAHKLQKERKLPKLIAIGQSLGGNILMRAIGDDPLKSEIDLVVLDSTFLSYQRIAKEKIQGIWFLYPIGWLSPLLVSDEYSPEKLIGSYENKALILHAKGDRVIPHSFGKEVFDKWGGPKRYILSPKGGHIEVLGNPKRDVQKELLEVIALLPQF